MVDLYSRNFEKLMIAFIGNTLRGKVSGEILINLSPVVRLLRRQSFALYSTVMVELK